jgi:CRISPR-associated protein Csb2
VRLTAVTGDAIEATHDLDADAGLFTVGATAVDRPLPGRLEELSRTHRDATGKPPLVSRDRFGTDEKSLSPVPPREMLETIRFRPRNAPSTPVPWPRALVIPAHRAVPVRDRVAWAVATHRALIKMIGLGAPALITGAYPEGVRRPVNRVALHFLGPAEGWSEPALVVLIPAEADSADLETLHNAVSGLTSVRGPGGNTLKLNPSGLRVLAGDQFWGTPEPGAMRLWRTVPATVPDTRGDRNGDWNFAHAALLSVGFVCRKLLPGKITGRGPDYYRALALAASEAGVTVLHAKVIRGVDADRYVHKVNEHAVIRPYTAVLSLGTLTGPTAIMAMGQSRHLGGGLLVPFDVPEGTPTDAVNLREIEHG